MLLLLLQHKAYLENKIRNVTNAKIDHANAAFALMRECDACRREWLRKCANPQQSTTTIHTSSSSSGKSSSHPPAHRICQGETKKNTDQHCCGDSCDSLTRSVLCVQCSALLDSRDFEQHNSREIERDTEKKREE